MGPKGLSCPPRGLELGASQCRVFQDHGSWEEDLTGPGGRVWQLRRSEMLGPETEHLITNSTCFVNVLYYILVNLSGYS